MYIVCIQPTPQPVLRIDLGSEVPAYRQIADGLRRSLVAGDLAPGAILPPVRQMAADLGVHFNTVAEAYRTLADEGWLDLKRGRGAMVLDRTPPLPPPAATEERQRFSRAVRDLVAKMRAAGLNPAEIAEEMKEAAKEVLK